MSVPYREGTGTSHLESFPGDSGCPSVPGRRSDFSPRLTRDRCLVSVEVGGSEEW